VRRTRNAWLCAGLALALPMAPLAAAQSPGPGAAAQTAGPGAMPQPTQLEHPSSRVPPKAAAPPAEPAARPTPVLVLPDTWYAQALTHSDVGINVTHFWSKGKMMRAETVVAGRRVVTIVNGDKYYAYDALQRSGVAIERSEDAKALDKGRDRPFGNEWAVLLRQGAELIRSEILGGREVELYQVTDGIGRRQVWVTKDAIRLPLRLDVYTRKSARTIQTDFLNWQTGLPIDDVFFSPDPGINLTELTLDEYTKLRRDRMGQVGPVPVLYSDLLHGY